MKNTKKTSQGSKTFINKKSGFSFIISLALIISFLIILMPNKTTADNLKNTDQSKYTQNTFLEQNNLDNQVLNNNILDNNQSLAFDDIANHWAKNAINFVTGQKLFNGTSTTKFSPNEGMTRGMFVTVIGRLAKVDNQKDFTLNFNDVAKNKYYAPYIAWASENSIVKGLSSTTFAPEKLISREEMALMLKNYLDFAQIDLAQKNYDLSLSDLNQIAPWAKDAVNYTLKTGLLKGKTNNLFEPKNTATRAEVATIFMRLSDYSHSYKSELKTVVANDGYNIQGKLNLPQSDEPIAKLIIFVNGSGPNTYDNKVAPNINYFDLFAQEITRTGAGFFSYSTRGITPNNAAAEAPYYNIDRTAYQSYTAQNSISDVEAMIKTLKKEPRLKNSKIYLLGHSEGSMIAPKVVQNNKVPVDGLILTGYCNDTMNEIFYDYQLNGHGSFNVYQYYLDYDNNNIITEAEFKEDRHNIFANTSAYFSDFDYNKDGIFTQEDIALALAPTKKIAQQAIADNDDDKLFENQIFLTSKWFKSHESLTPNKDMLYSLNLPIYIFHGSLDANTPVTGVYSIQNKFKSLNKNNLKVKIYEEYDHNLQFGKYIFDQNIPQSYIDIFDLINKL